MKPVPDNSLFNTFIKETLKTTNEDLTPIDWSEVEVLLRHEKKPISVGISKRAILLSAAGAMIILCILGVFQLVRHYASLPSHANKAIAPAQNTFHVIIDSTASVIKTAKIGSSFTNEEMDTSSDITFMDTVSSKKTTVAVKPAQKPEKKKKQDTLLSVRDTSTEKVKAEDPPVGDTASKPPIRETKTETQPARDTTAKKFSPWWKKSRNKKSSLPADTKPDSLKSR